MTKVLIVDDDEAVRSKALQCLERDGVELVAADSGESAFRLARAFRPDVVISDIDMPGMDGFELLALLRADPGLANVQIMMLTAKGSRDSVRLGMELGADDYLTKPFTRAELLNAFDGLLKKRGRIAGERARVFRRHWWQLGAAYVLALLGCAVAAYSWSGWRNARDDLAHDRLRLETAASTAAQHSQAMLGEAAKVLVRVRAAQRAGGGSLPPDCRAFFRQLLSESPQLVNLGVVGMDGRISCDTEGEGEGAFVGDRAHVKQAIETGTFAPGEFSLSGETGRPVLTAGLPLRDDAGNRVGVAFSSIDASAPFDAGEVPTLADSQKIATTTPLPGSTPTTAANSDDPSELAKAGGPPGMLLTDSKHESLMTGYLLLFGVAASFGLVMFGWATGVFEKLAKLKFIKFFGK